MLQPNATFIGQIIVFLLLLWFIYSFVVPMIAKPVNERYKRIADGLAAAEAGQKELQAANARANDILREARERARQIDDQAQRRSQEALEAAKQAAEAEGARIITARQAEAANEAARARDELRREYGALVVQGASQLLEREVDARAHAQLIDRLAEQIARE
ncbi:MAG TPA: F0F1 ATP synthase subunit B [Steroidobacteraceae bacterium]|jgi:F-type H+-transporting ATPase subunit b|nr:F0F1 ATP synthase subunit B [Steroidobacteraceae bacterium]